MAVKSSKVVVLNFPFSPKPYTGELDWIHFFVVKRDVKVIATPLMMRKEDFALFSGLKSVKVLPVDSFDTCDRWKVGLKEALALGADYCFLWSADFFKNHNSMGAASLLLDHPGNEDLVVGTIRASGTKEAIDVHGTYRLLQIWFPDEAKVVLEDKRLTKPRSELFRISSHFLTSCLQKRWYPTEQTIHLILQAIWSGNPACVAALSLPSLSDDPSFRGSFKGTIQQLERMNLWLKYMWWDRHPQFTLDEYIRNCQLAFDAVQEACRAIHNQ